MGMPNDVSLIVALAADYCPMGQSIALWDHDGCMNVFVPSLRSDFLLKGRKEIVCLLIVQVGLSIWSVYETNFLKLSPDKVSSPPFPSHP